MIRAQAVQGLAAAPLWPPAAVVACLLFLSSVETTPGHLVLVGGRRKEGVGRSETDRGAGKRQTQEREGRALALDTLSLADV